jgi:hypothetical protein
MKHTIEQYQEALNDVGSFATELADRFCGQTIAKDYGLFNSIKKRVDELQELIDEKKMLPEKIELVSRMHPYKERGNFDTYCEYNQGWSDCIDYIEQVLGIEQ